MTTTVKGMDEGEWQGMDGEKTKAEKQKQKQGMDWFE